MSYQTVGDLCSKRVGLKHVDEFHNLLSKLVQGLPEDLENTLIANSEPACHARIHQYLNGIRGQGTTGTGLVMQMQVSIFLPVEVYWHLRQVAAAEHSEPDQWLGKTASEVIEDKYDDWRRRQAREVQSGSPPVAALVTPRPFGVRCGVGSCQFTAAGDGWRAFCDMPPLRCRRSSSSLQGYRQMSTIYLLMHSYEDLLGLGVLDAGSWTRPTQTCFYVFFFLVLMCLGQEE